MRKQIASFLLTASVVTWGIWCGGQYFNEARVIPKMLSNPPESVAAYNAIPTEGGLPFFFMLNLLIFLYGNLAIGFACLSNSSALFCQFWLCAFGRSNRQTEARSNKKN